MVSYAALLGLASWACNSPPSSSDRVADAPNLAGQNDSKAEYAADSIIVKFRDVPSSNKSAHLALKGIKASILDKNKDGIYDRYANIAQGRLAVVQLDKSENVDDVLARLRKDSSIEYAEPNYIVHALATPNDPRFNELWGLDNTGQTGGTADADVDGPEAWDNTIGSADIVVGVVDTGVDYTHEDLAANMWVNPNEIPGNGNDDDGNGVIDDVHGFNAIDGSGDPMDDNDHGSHCSGTIGAVGGNGIGVAGVNWEVSIMALKFLSAGGSGTTDGAIAAINYAVAQRQAGVNIRVLSNSWGGGGFSQALEDAITAANDEGILFVAAAGNSSSNNDSSPHFPSNYEVENVVAVAASDHNDSLASFSSFGATTVDLAAPGVDVLSTIPGNSYASFSGTSMATPHVAGAAALVLSNNDTLTISELKDALYTSVDPIPAFSGLMVTGGRLNAAAAVDEAGPPIPRFNLSVSPASQVVVQEESTSYTIDLTSVAGFTGDVDLSLVANPAFDASTTVTITPSTVTAPGTATVDITTTQGTAPGIYSLAITGSNLGDPANPDDDLIKTRSVSLTVRPFGTVEVPFPSDDTPIAIPDNNATGITSVITVNQPIDIQEVQVQLDVTHTFIGDLVITLTSPDGTLVTLHDRAGGGTDNIHQLYSFPTQFTGELSAGDWTLHIVDLAGADTGTLDSWELRIIGVVGSGTFGLSAGPDLQQVAQGDTATYDVTVEAFGDFDRDVELSVVPSAPVLIATIDPSTINTSGTATLSVGTSLLTPPGVYTLAITGTDGVDTSTVSVTIDVKPFGSIVGTYPSEDTPISIPDNNMTGITSTINVPDSISINELAVQVDITHTFIGDLIVTLTSPSGTSLILHNGTGGGADNIHEIYQPTEFNGEDSRGDWTLHVRDRFAFDTGTLDFWSLSITGLPLDTAPVADFTYSANFQEVSFTDASTDDGAIVAWAWDFGDGNTSTEQNPTHSYAAAGLYTVSLTVTDDAGQSSTTSQEVNTDRNPPLLWIVRVSRDFNTYEYRVDLAWSGAEGALVELYRNGLLADIPNNDGAMQDRFRRYDTSYTWQICEQFSTFCTNEVSIVFGASENEVKVVTGSGDKQVVQTMQVIEE